jgi:hypothetical protein
MCSRKVVIPSVLVYPDVTGYKRDTLTKTKPIGRDTVPKAFSGRDAAMSVAIDALGFLAGDPERIGPFLAMSGIDPGEIRQAARSPGFLAGVLDHLCASESLLLDFATQSGRRPEEIDTARRILAGPGADGLREG